MTEKVFKPHPDFQKISEEWRKKWSDALRSGDYEQGKGYLYANGKYCCLGVLQDIHDKPVLDPNGNPAPALFCTQDPVEMECGYIAKTFGLHGYYDVAGPSLNDEDELTFAQIADLIDGKEVVVSE